jgi:hypothetical protein
MKGGEFMVTIPEKNFFGMAGLSLIGSFAICGGIAYGAYKIIDKFIIRKVYKIGD